MNSLVVLIVLIISSCQVSTAFPLHRNSRWIVNEHGERVKLACVNWPAHLETMFAEGLGKEPLDVISQRIVSMGFNCVRFTWSLFMATNDTLGNTTVRQIFAHLGLNESIASIEVNNPSLIDLPVIRAYQEVVWALGKNNLMVILDNHISKPGWCCASTDGNGFFGDQYFDPALWTKGLRKMAALFNETTNVIGMSLRNEFRGQKQNVGDWYKYTRRGAEAVHSVNPNVLVILSGLNFDNNLGFLHNRMVNTPFSRKIVYELHWYSFSDGTAWLDGNANNVCGRIAGNMMKKAGFLIERGWPLFLSEFGIDQTRGSVAENHYLSCVLSVAADLDLDWAIWALQGSYYLRQGKMGSEERFGVLSYDWCSPRNLTLLQRISSIQPPFRGPGLTKIPLHNLLFHPATGLCVVKRYLLDPPHLGPCSESQPWTYTNQRTITMQNNMFCLQGMGVGLQPELGRYCESSNARWDQISATNMHLATQLVRDGNIVCLDVGTNGTIVTNSCKCLNDDKECDPQSQWFKVIFSSRDPAHRNNSPSSKQNDRQR